jgi:hypothetical protein
MSVSYQTLSNPSRNKRDRYAIGNTLQSLSHILHVDPDLVPRIDRTLPADYLDISAAVEDDWSQQVRHDIDAKPPKRGAFVAVHTGNTASEDDSTASGVQKASIKGEWP